MVKEYKYLGIYFTWNLDWGHHIKYMIRKAKDRTAELTKLLVNHRISVKAKLLVWFAYVRPLLEYGCEVWDANSSQVKSLESVQHKAGALAFKVNEKTNRRAIRTLMGCTSLETRHSGFRLRYLRKLWSMDENRLTRYVVTLPDINKGRGRRSWLKETLEIVHNNDKLKVGYHKLITAACRNNGRVPTQAERLSEDVELDHRKDWEGRVESWAQATEINAISREAEEARSTLGLIARSLRKVDKIPQFPLAKATNVQGSVRARLLGGTSGLNSTLSKFRNR